MTYLYPPVEYDRISSRYAHVYPSLALMSTVLLLFPLITSTDQEFHRGVVLRTGTILHLAAHSPHGYQTALIALAIMIVLLVTATFRARHPMLPGTIVGMSALVTLVLATKPGFVEADLTSYGQTLGVVTTTTAVITVVHTVHLWVARLPWWQERARASLEAARSREPPGG